MLRILAENSRLTAALEFCRQPSIKPIVVEASNRIDRLSCTIGHNDNRIDIGGHRFFSKSDRVMDWWTTVIPIANSGEDEALSIRYQNQRRLVRFSCSSDGRSVRESGYDGDPDCVMLVRPRKSRIYFMRSFFDYPLSLSRATLRRLGIMRTFRIFIDTDQRIWLTYGSYWTGIKQQEIDPATGMLLASNPVRYELAARSFVSDRAVEGASLSFSNRL